VFEDIAVRTSNHAQNNRIRFNSDIWNSTCNLQLAEHLSLTGHVTALGVAMLETTIKTVDIHWVLRILISGPLAGRTGFVFQQRKTFFLTSTRPVARAQLPAYKLFYILLTVHHVMILGKLPTWRTNSFLCIYFYL